MRREHRVERLVDRAHEVGAKPAPHTFRQLLEIGGVVGREDDLPDPVAQRREDAPPQDFLFEAAWRTQSEAIQCLLLVLAWRRSKATGQDTPIDAEFAASVYEGMLPMDDMLRNSGHFGPRVEVPDDADPVTKLIAFTGRTP